jgi:hypothetical protein
MLEHIADAPKSSAMRTRGRFVKGFGSCMALLLKALHASDLTCLLGDRQRQPRLNSSAFHGSRVNLEVPS